MFGVTGTLKDALKNEQQKACDATDASAQEMAQLRSQLEDLSKQEGKISKQNEKQQDQYEKVGWHLLASKRQLTSPDLVSDCTSFWDYKLEAKLQAEKIKAKEAAAKLKAAKTESGQMTKQLRRATSDTQKLTSSLEKQQELNKQLECDLNRERDSWKETSATFVSQIEEMKSQLQVAERTMTEQREATDARSSAEQTETGKLHSKVEELTGALAAALDQNHVS